MNTQFYPITTLPHTTRLYREFLAMDDRGDAGSPVRGWYGADPLGSAWMRPQPAAAGTKTAALADALERQARGFGAGAATLANIARLREGCRAVVTGQQVGLLGGPLLTLLKAATAVARARQATIATGVEHVPIFWLATEDHDLAEVDQVSLLSKTAVETLHLNPKPVHPTAPVGDVVLDESTDALLDRACELLQDAPVCGLLRECYGHNSGHPLGGNHGPTFASAFARLMTRLFAGHGLIVMDAAGRDFHALGASALQYAIEHAEELEAALLARTAELEAAGYHAQVLVKPGASLLFLVSDSEREGGGVRNRQALGRATGGAWKVGAGSAAETISTAELLAILDSAPERLSPSALLRPVFQDTILPTTAYIGGPSEVAYFAQSSVLYERIAAPPGAAGGGRITPILPRLSATLIEPAIAELMAQHEVSLPDAMVSADDLAQLLAARALPVEAKRRLAAADDALDRALTAVQQYLGDLDERLAQSAEVSASKMRYQMGRLRRLGTTFELQRQAVLRKHAEAMTLHLFPNAHPQERVLAGVWFLAAWEAARGDAPGAAPDAAPGAGLIARLVDAAADQTAGHRVIRL